MKAIRIFGRNIRDAFKSVFRNFSLSFASISCITITLLVVAIAVILSYNVNNFTKLVEQDVTIVTFMDKDTTKEKAEEYVEKVKEYAKAENAQVITVCAKIESELSELNDEDKLEFLKDLGIEESGLNKLIKATYDLLGLATYFTAGSDEVRAWTFKKGMKAPQCAGIIHTDFEKGFIKAEVMSYDDLKLYGNDKAVKEAAEFEAQDKKRKEGIEARNDADAMVFQTEKALKEVGDKVSADDKAKVQAEIDKVKAILERTQPESMTDADIEELKAAKESLMTNSQQVFAKMYEQAQQAAGGAQGAAGPDMGAAGQQTADNGGDDVVDGDFREL